MTPLYDYFTAWATVIHLSHGNNGSGMKLKDLARSADERASVSGGLLLLLKRATSRGTSRSARKSYEYSFPASVRSRSEADLVTVVDLGPSSSPISSPW